MEATQCSLACREGEEDLLEFKLQDHDPVVQC